MVQSTQPPLNTDHAIEWFRKASPYINEHRNKTVVLCVPDRLLASDLLSTVIYDLTLLSHLGVRLVVCFGVRSDVDARLAVAPIYHDGRRVTDDHALSTVIEASGVARNALESHFSMGLPNTPMAGAHVSVTSGNFVTAQPYGVHNGVDFLHSGKVREVQTGAVQSLLKAGHLVLLPPIGYSLTGEVFNIPAEEVAVEAAIALQADKLVMFVPTLASDDDEQSVREASAKTLRKIAATQGSDHLARTYLSAASASERGVPRVHLLPESDPNSLLRELFTIDGAGTLITSERFESLRTATIQDVGGIIELVEPLQKDGTLVHRSREQLEIDIEHFVVLERDGRVVACAALFFDSDEQRAEIACLVTHPDYRGSGRAAMLVSHLEKEARSSGARLLAIRTTRTAHWFIERGFEQADVTALPSDRQKTYNPARNAQVYAKTLN